MMLKMIIIVKAANQAWTFLTHQKKLARISLLRFLSSLVVMATFTI